MFNLNFDCGIVAILTYDSEELYFAVLLSFYFLKLQNECVLIKERNVKLNYNKLCYGILK